MVLHISGSAREVIVVAGIAALFLSAAWLSLIGAGLVGEAIVASEHLRRRSLDSQLIRLGMRFVGIVVAIGLLMQAASKLGFPAYSVLAGLGVGGLAVALAARDSLANLFGSVLIMFEKPFRVGHRIRVVGSEGVVEEVGFRSISRISGVRRLSKRENGSLRLVVRSVSLISSSRFWRRGFRRSAAFIQPWLALSEGSQQPPMCARW